MKHRSPLFEKLMDEDLESIFEKNPKQFSSVKELQNSIMEDLSRLLNTRVAVFWKNYADRNPTEKNAVPFCYGINATGAIFSENLLEMQQLEARIDDVIRRFEPRLKDAKAQILKISSDSGSLFLSIEATAIIEKHRVHMSFPIVVDTNHS